MKKIMFAIVIGFALGSLSFAQARTGELERGIFHQEGIASWYGAEFNGRPTASGEIFNDSMFTAAHPILPFGTMVKVTNRHNNKTVIVRVNDRGPFVAQRIIDVSRAAAQQLEMIATGTAPVLMESLDEVALPARSAQGSAAVQNTAPQSPIPSAQPLTQSSAQVLYPSEMFNQPSILLDVNKIYRIQVGAYKQPQNAMDVFDKLKMAGLNPDYEPYGDYCRVVLKRIKQEDLKMVTERVESAGFRDIIVREE